MEKKRVIVDYKNITQELLQLFTSTYPYGYDDFVVRFKNAKGELVSSVPLETEDTKYLVKVGVELDRVVEAYLDDDDNEDASGPDLSNLPDGLDDDNADDDDDKDVDEADNADDDEEEDDE